MTDESYTYTYDPLVEQKAAAAKLGQLMDFGYSKPHESVSASMDFRPQESRERETTCDALLEALHEALPGGQWNEGTNNTTNYYKGTYPEGTVEVEKSRQEPFTLTARIEGDGLILDLARKGFEFEGNGKFKDQLVQEARSTVKASLENLQIRPHATVARGPHTNTLRYQMQGKPTDKGIV